jgi:arylsulfatase A-like enzyme
MRIDHRAALPVALLAIALGIFVVAGCSDDGGRRHVLLLTVDTLRPDYLSINGYDRPSSPFLDSLLSTGTRFDRALTPIPRTTPALASLLTGCYPHTTGVRTLFDTLLTDVHSIAQLAKQRGYNTVAVVSNHVLPPSRELNRGFDIYDFAGDARDAAQTTDAAIRQLGSFGRGDRMFVWVHYIDPHVPYYPPVELARDFDPDYRGRYRDHFGEVRGGVGNEAYPKDIGKIRAVFQNDLPDEVNAHIRRLYAADVRFNDDNIERLLQWMRSQLGDDWTIVFTSDHGESLGEHDYYYDHGDYVYNATLRVPLGFVFPPGDELGGSRTIDDWVSLIDVMPTLMEILDFEIPPDLSYSIEGRSLAPYLRGEPLPPRPFFAECGWCFHRPYVPRRVSFDVPGRFRSVIVGEWKLIWTPGQTGDLKYELYDLADDPHETVNLIAEHPDQANKLIALLKRWTDLSDDRKHRKISDSDMKLLRSLGYVQ